MEGLRLRRRPLDEVVQQLDAFPKVSENVQEEKRTSGGILSLASFFVMGCLIVGELWTFWDAEFKYSFPVDRDFGLKLGLDVDLVVAMPCGSIGADVMDSSDRALTNDEDRKLHTTPTSFVMREREQRYWDALKAAHALQARPGQSFKALDESTYVAESVIAGLNSEAAEKEAEVAKETEAQEFNPFAAMFGGGGGGGGGIRIIANQGGVLQLIEIGGGGGDGGGDACRVSGQIPIGKASGNLHIAPGKSLPMGGGAHAHLNMFGSERTYNFSHRIERFGFGPRVAGLVTPLAGTEKISTNHMDLYQYYLKIVPTRVYSVAASLGLAEPITTYQYSVTHRKRAIHHDKGSHGMPGLNIKYELSSLTVEVREVRQSLWSLVVRLCSVVGGVFATSQILDGLLRVLLGLVLKKAPVVGLKEQM